MPGSSRPTDRTAVGRRRRRAGAGGALDGVPRVRLAGRPVRRAGHRPAGPRPGTDRLYEAVGHPDAREHLRGALRASCDMFAVDRDVLADTLASMSALDPATVGGTIARADESRRGGTAHLADRLQEQGLLRPDVTRDEAAQLLWVLSSFDTFDSLYVGYALDVDATAGLLIRTAERALVR